MKKEKLIIDGNTIYELDLECLRKKEEKRKQYHRGKPEWNKKETGKEQGTKRGQRG